MWQLRRLSCFTPPEPQQALLNREALALQQQAQQIRVAAEQEAQRLLDEAHQQAQQIQQQAQAESDALLEKQQAHFWQQAQMLFDDWHEQRETQQQQVVSLASQLLAQALAHCLAEVPSEQRLQALLTQLMNRLPSETQATLYCAPCRQAPLAAWLSARPALRWQLTPDEGLEIDALRLVTAQGELQISWQAFCQSLSGG
ncbi:type III secretion system stator protein SctL [Pantoea alhagi]|uniref:type III secretion system stator protein SctL n=1 Tax=Pantoea alhagi TaxID=1891675 RepID=UPI00202B69F6|nr:type III secretion system stator protein SctL [Pantoea alhagi]URQ61351.1 type III secretion system stator protein SctL [Pantoea alhagi]